MALEAVVYPPEPLNFYGFNKDFYSHSSGGSASPYDFCFQDEEKSLLDNTNLQNSDPNAASAGWDASSTSVMGQHANDNLHHQWDPYSSTDDGTVFPQMEPRPQTATPAAGARRKRRRTRSTKNKEELENQRMTHITVERNRRKQMNEYLAMLRSLMPLSYVQRGDQASIIGGAINFVKELEQLLQSMKARKRTTHEPDNANSSAYASPFAEFFSFPQYSTRATQSSNSPPVSNEPTAESVADIEVTMVESHASLKILSKKRPRQLLKLVTGLQGLRLGILHLNVTTVDQIVLYSISVKVEEGCYLNTVDEIAAAVNEMLLRIQEEAASS